MRITRSRKTVSCQKSEDVNGIDNVERDANDDGTNDEDTDTCQDLPNNINGYKGSATVLDVNSSQFDSADVCPSLDGLGNGTPTQENNTPEKKTSCPEDESLDGVLKELNLYEDLYEFMKSKDITPEALKYMKERHIDELFNGSRLNLKIIFEHRLAEWQEKRKQNDEKEVSMNISHKSSHGEKDKLLSIKYPNGITSSYHMQGANDLTHLSNRLMEVIQNSLSAVLMEFKTFEDQHTFNNIEGGNSDVPEPEQAATVLIEPVMVHANQPDIIEKLNIISVDTVAEGLLQPLATVPVEQNSNSESMQSTKEDINPESQTQEECLKANKPSNQIINSNMLEPSISHNNNKRKWGIETELREILLMYKPGNFILKYYQNFGILTAKLRSDLVHIIVDHFILNNEFVCVTQCKLLAEQIVDLFPTESLETYFDQENRSITPKGKLWNLYQNERRLQKKESYMQYTKSNRLKMESTCLQLKNIEDENFLLKKWNKTFHYRRYQLHSEYFSNWKMYFDEYPFCKQQSYALFIDTDLAALYPDLTFDDQLWDDFLNNFQIFFWNRIKHKQSKELFDKLSSMDDLYIPSDYFPIRIMQLLHAVLNNTACLEDAQRQFTVEVSDLTKLKEIVIDRKKYCLDHDIQCKPYIAVVRENNTYVHYSVVLDSTGFGCDNYKESLILCFKLYLFFDISYPQESFSVWLFIQKYFFNKHSLVIDPAVDAFIHDIRSQTKVDLEVRS